jgi:hypothetical protein
MYNMSEHHPTQFKLAAFAAAVLIGISILAYQNIGFAGAGLVIAGGLAGISLFQASFG